MDAVISKGITLSYKAGDAGEFIALTNLQEIPELGGDKDKIEVTTLADGAHKYTNGIDNYGDSIAFKFLYEKTQFTTLCGLDEDCEWKVALPDSTAYTFSGIPSVKLDGVGVSAALTYTLAITPTSEMAVA